MTVKDIISQIEFDGENIISKTTNKQYDVVTFVNLVSKTYKLKKKEVEELNNYFTGYLKPQTEVSKYIENIIKKYDFKFSNGIYFVRNEVKTIDEIYKLMWAEQKLLPTDVDIVIENIEKISEELPLQENIFNIIKSKRKDGKSQYLKSLDTIYPNIKWREILYNIIVPNTKPLFHIFYDDGTGGTGKSTLLEVITKIVGENFTSNVLLDQFSNRFIFANMLGKYVNIGDDNGKNEELQNIGTLKSIITGNRITIDRKNISPIEVRIFAKQLFATNILPYIDFTDGGIMRRLNIVAMNKVIPSNLKLCNLDDNEIGYIINEVLNSKDLEHNENELAITTSPLYRFYEKSCNKRYEDYKVFCDINGFKKLNIINFEVKSRFINSYLKTKKNLSIEELTNYNGDLPF